METTGLNLLISDKPDVERDAVAEAFARGGGAVRRIARFWDPPALDPNTVRVYGADSFCLVLQQKLGFTLCSPDDELLLRVPSGFLKRQITRQLLGEVAAFTFPSFVKPVVPKQFRGAVYQSSVELVAESRGLSDRHSGLCFGTCDLRSGGSDIRPGWPGTRLGSLRGNGEII